MKHFINNVLVVDNEPKVRQHIERMLLKSRFKVKRIFEAENGIEAIEILSRNPVNLVLTGINMPVMSGTELLNILHNHPRFMNLPVIAVTEVKDEKLSNMLSSWGDGYVQKPITTYALENQISKTYGKSNEYSLHG